MLDSGVIRWNGIKLSLNASAHLPYDFFRNIFTTLEETLSNVRTDWDNVPKKDFAKEAINSMLGLWSKPKQYKYKVETVSFTEDLQRSGHVMKRAVGHA